MVQRWTRVTIFGTRPIVDRWQETEAEVYDTEPEDAGVYSCEVGEQKSTAKLTVEEPGVEFVTKLPDVTLVPLNADAVFVIEISRDVPVTWMRKRKS